MIFAFVSLTFLMDFGNYESGQIVTRLKSIKNVNATTWQMAFHKHQITAFLSREGWRPLLTS
jgi:hypothetical protein